MIDKNECKSKTKSFSSCYAGECTNDQFYSCYNVLEHIIIDNRTASKQKHPETIMQEGKQ